jgi:hypothetical protein
MKVLLTEWLKTMFLPRTENPRAKANYTVPVLLLFDGQSTPVPDDVIAFAQSEIILIIGLVSHSSHLSQPRDLCTFGLLKRFEKNEQKQKLEGETLKIYRALHAFYKVAIIPMVRWSLTRTRFRHNSANLMCSPYYQLCRISDQNQYPRDVSGTAHFPRAD